MSNPSSSVAANTGFTSTSPPSEAPTVPQSWEPPSNPSDFFPKHTDDRLANAQGYFAWAHLMRQGFEIFNLMEIVDGTLQKPTDAMELVTWQKMNATARALISGCVKPEIIPKIAHLTTAHDAWDLLAGEFSQLGTGSIIHWFRRLTQHMPSGGDVSTHISGYQEAIWHLANADLVIPDFAAAAMLLSTLPCDPKDADSWDYFLKGVRLNKTTTLSRIASEILEEKRRQMPAKTTTSSETALAALERFARANGTKFCTNCKREGHTKDECWGKGGGKESKGPKRKAKSKKKGKGNENAKITTEEGGDETSKIILESCLLATETTSHHLRPPRQS